VAFMVFAVPAFADPLCASGSLARIIGTTCDIGSLQFTFNSWSSFDQTNTGISAGPEASSFAFTPVTDGFMITGSRVMVAPGSGEWEEDIGRLGYSVVDLTGEITGEDLFANILGLNTAGPLGFEAGVRDTLTGACVYIDTGLGITTCPLSTPVGGLSSGAGDAIVYDLEGDNPSIFAYYGNASWAGSTTFIYETTPVPEPSSLLLLVTFCGLIYASRRKRASPYRRRDCGLQ